MKILSFIFFISIGLLSAPVAAQQFSASAVMSTPGRADVTTQLYYSPGRIRKEFYYYGEPVIQILDANKHVNLMCFNDQQLCYENPSLEQINIGIKSAISSPCKNNKALKCENLGKTELNKRPAIKWKIVAKDGDKELESYLWLDDELKIPVRQTMFNGTTVELEWLGSEKLNNRDTDKWRQVIKYPSGETQESYQWFDKELKIIIRETFPDGNIQELKHIVVENIPDKLFTIPVGFEKKTMKNQQNSATKTQR
jgi:hypothetical protein